MLDDKAPLKIGYYVDDGYVTSVPAMRRAVMETVDKLRANGHTVSGC